jgi:hypothetical protein
MSDSCECCMLSGRSLYDGPIISPEESYRMCGVSENDSEALIIGRPWPTSACRTKEKKYIYIFLERNLKSSCLQSRPLTKLNFPEQYEKLHDKNLCEHAAYTATPILFVSVI